MSSAPGAVRASSGSGLLRLLTAAMWAVQAMYLLGLTRHGRGFDPLVDGWACVVSQVLPALVCWASLPHARGRRTEVVWLAAGISSFAVGNIVLVLAEARHQVLPVPSFASAGYLAFYPAAVVAVVLAVHRQHPTSRWAVYLDSALAGLGAAALTALLLGSVFAGSSAGWLASVVSLAFPVFDLALVAVLVAITFLQPRPMPWPWVCLLSGFALFAAADVIYDRRIAEGSYVVGSVLDCLWSLGLALMSLWARSPARFRRVGPDAGTFPLAVPAIALLSSVTVLVVASVRAIPLAAVVLATLTLLAAGGRTQVAFLQQRRWAELTRQAMTDDLTGLPNRRAFYEHVRSQLSRTPEAALLLLDLDKFKEINDALGHHIGDQLLVSVGQRLATHLRQGDLLARLGGDEFGLLVTGTDLAATEVVASKIHRTLAEPFAVGDIALSTDASIGIAMSPVHGTDIETLLRRADIAMYKAKRVGSGHGFYDPADDADGAERLRLVQELRVALAGGQFRLHFQPKIELTTAEVRGVEALVRWEHPSRGLLLPSAFLGVAEESGLMPALTRAVLEQALDQARTWQDAGTPLVVAVNVSASSLVDDELPEQVADLLESRALAPEALELEITEELLMADRERGREILHRLQAMGIRISVDDFGTGYSSLAYLRELPIDELKLDRSFVSPMTEDPRATALVISTIGLAHSLGLRIVAEGVETAEALVTLTRNGCDEAQGFYVCAPLPAPELDDWLRQQRRHDAAVRWAILGSNQ